MELSHEMSCLATYFKYQSKPVRSTAFDVPWISTVFVPSFAMLKNSEPSVDATALSLIRGTWLPTRRVIALRAPVVSNGPLTSPLASVTLELVAAARTSCGVGTAIAPWARKPRSVVT